MWGADEAEGCNSLNGVEPSRVQLLYNVENVRREQNWVISDQEAVGRWKVVTCSSKMLKNLHSSLHRHAS